jgi:hypothetical protein
MLTTGSIVVPGTGIRRLHINARADVQGFNGAPLSAGIQVIGTGVVYGTLMCRVQGNGDFYRETMAGTGDITAPGGTQTWNLWGYVFDSANSAQFQYFHMQVIDKGPA